MKLSGLSSDLGWIGSRRSEFKEKCSVHLFSLKREGEESDGRNSRAKPSSRESQTERKQWIPLSISPSIESLWSSIPSNPSPLFATSIMSSERSTLLTRRRPTRNCSYRVIFVVSVFLFVSFFFPPVSASLGDNSNGYKYCVAGCMQDTCAFSSSESSQPHPRSSTFYPSSFPYTPFWSCPSLCSYACTQSLTDLSLTWSIHPRAGEVVMQKTHPIDGLFLGKMTQFHGKWPLKKWWFVQEPMAVLASIGNGWGAWVVWKRLWGLGSSSRLSGAANSPSWNRLKFFYLLNTLVALNTWIWSTIFHIRDLPWSEKCDYFSAGAGTCFVFWLAVVRVWGGYLENQDKGLGLDGHATSEYESRNGKQSGWLTIFRRPRPSILRKGSILVGTVMFLAHVRYLLSGERFDYGYNIKANVGVALTTMLIYLYWTISTRIHRRQLHHLPSPPPPPPSPLPQLLTLSLLTLLEVLDFPPWPSGLRLVDAHALWHISTIGVVIWWGRYLEKDLEWEREWGRATISVQDRIAERRQKLAGKGR